MKIGIDAIPEIIAHLDDRRPTCCEGLCSTGPSMNEYLLCYGDCCQQIIQKLSGHAFVDSNSFLAYPIRYGQAAQCKARAERWWRKYQQKGERQLLIEETQVGRRDSPGQARRLIARYPADAMKAITSGVRQGDDQWARANLLLCTAQIHDDQPLPLLRRELNGPYLKSRIAAAKALIERGDSEGVRAVVREWQQYRWEDSLWFSDRFELNDLIHCLVRSGEAETIRALSKDFNNKPSSIRFAIINSFQALEKDLQGRPLSPEFRSAEEDLLVTELGDHEPWEDAPASNSGKTAILPILGDMVALILVDMWKSPALFDLYTPLETRERQRLDVKNFSLRKAGKKPLLLIPTKRIDPCSEETVRPLLVAAQSAASTEARRDPLRQLEKLGLAALPAIRRFLAAMKPDEPCRGDLEDLARRVALTIVSVTVTEDSLQPGDDLLNRMREFRGKPILSEKILNLIYATTQYLPPGCQGIRVTADRPGVDSGVRMIITLIVRKPGIKTDVWYGTTRGSLYLDGRTIFEQSGDLHVFTSTSHIKWDHFAAWLESQLSATPEKPLHFQLSFEKF